jgi:hypothetical protein
MLLQMSRCEGALILLLTSALAGAGCGSESPPSFLPTAPTAVATPPTGGTPPPAVSSAATVSGKVYDTANRPIAGATIEVLDGVNAGMTTTSDRNGQYWLTGVFAEGTRFRASREGYLENFAKVGAYCGRCTPQYWVYFALGLPAAPANIAGEYTMTVEGCDALPAEMRTRTYPATIVPDAYQPTAATTYFRVDFAGSSLVRGVWDGLWIAVAANDLELEMGDLHGQPGLIEQLDADTYFSVGAWGRATVTTPVTTFTSVFEGEIYYCVMKPGVPVLDADRRHACSGADRSVTRIGCPGGRLTFNRR